MRLKLIISYDGTPFSGWQSQPSGNTVQDILEKTFFQILGKRVVLHGAGRTDTGVHALAQCAHVDLPLHQNKMMKLEEWLRALNAQLPPGIRILKVTEAEADFHARFSASGKVYQYRIWNAEVMLPLERDRVWHVPGLLNFDFLRSNAAFFEGRHNFASFAASYGGGKKREDTFRTIQRVQMTRHAAGKEVRLTFEGEGFLYKMVRMLTGALIRVGQGKEDPVTWIPRLLTAPTETAQRYVAPAHGLYLVKVLYK